MRRVDLAAVRQQVDRERKSLHPADDLGATLRVDGDDLTGQPVAHPELIVVRQRGDSPIASPVASTRVVMLSQTEPTARTHRGTERRV
ncbi:hypothetical protein GCM10009844_29640 [Nocardioides koreensis]|uniref:Uncharacterized protein n=1 Tax=Nocardioides koreensis TaxID=433651 RepID=A0ABP5LLM9_9ACTN